MEKAITAVPSGADLYLDDRYYYNSVWKFKIVCNLMAKFRFRKQKKVKPEIIYVKEDSSEVYDKCNTAIKESLQKIADPDNKNPELIEEYVETLSSKLDEYLGKEVEKKHLIAEDKIILEFVELYEIFKIMRKKVEETPDIDIKEALSKFDSSFVKKFKKTGTELMITNSIGKEVDYENMEIVDVKAKKGVAADTVIEEIDEGYYVRHGETIREQRVIVAVRKKNA